MLFNNALESVIRQMYDTDVGIRLLNKKINLFAYANDIVLIGKTKEEIKTLVELHIGKSKPMGLIVCEKRSNI